MTGQADLKDRFNFVGIAAILLLILLSIKKTLVAVLLKPLTIWSMGLEAIVLYLGAIIFILFAIFGGPDNLFKFFRGNL